MPTAPAPIANPSFLPERLKRLMENRKIDDQTLSLAIGGDRHLVRSWLRSKGRKLRIPDLSNIDAVAKVLHVPCEAFSPEYEARWTSVSRFGEGRFDRLLPEIHNARTCLTLHTMLPSSLVPRECFTSPELRAALLARGWKTKLLDSYLNTAAQRTGGSVIPDHCRHFVISDRRFIEGLSRDWLQKVVPHALQAHKHRMIAVGFLHGSSFDGVTEVIQNITGAGAVERLSIFDDMLVVRRVSYDHYDFTYHPDTVSQLREVLDRAAGFTEVPLPLQATNLDTFRQHNLRVMAKMRLRPHRPR